MMLQVSGYQRFIQDRLIPFRDKYFHPVDNPYILALYCMGVLLMGILAFYFFRSLKPSSRKKFIVITTFFAGLYFSVEFFIPKDNFMTPLKQPTFNFLITVFGFLILLAMINMVRLHGTNVAKLKKGWYNSAALLLSIVVMCVFTLWKLNVDNPPDFVPKGFQILFFGFFASLKATVFSILAFYIVSAAYRAFRIKSAEAAFMMFSALLIMLGQMTIMTKLTSGIPLESFWANFRLDNIYTWIQLVPGMAAYRAIVLGVSVGYLAISLRMWLSLEKGAYFDQEM